MVKFVIRDDNALLNAINYVKCLTPDEDEPREIVIQDFKKLRSVQQNSLYWRWLGIIRKDTGTSKEALHHYYKKKFLPTFVEVHVDEIITVLTSTKDLTPAQFSDYLTEIEEHASDFHNIILPHEEDLNYGRCG